MQEASKELLKDPQRAPDVLEGGDIACVALVVDSL